MDRVRKYLQERFPNKQFAVVKPTAIQGRRQCTKCRKWRRHMNTSGLCRRCCPTCQRLRLSLSTWCVHHPRPAPVLQRARPGAQRPRPVATAVEATPPPPPQAAAAVPDPPQPAVERYRAAPRSVLVARGEVPRN